MMFIVMSKHDEEYDEDVTSEVDYDDDDVNDDHDDVLKFYYSRDKT
jgi:hypothetical protein